MNRQTSLFILLFCICGCSTKNISWLEKHQIHVTQKALDIGDKTAAKKLQLQYIGCGGIIIRHANQIIMVDPFFSNPRFGRIGRSMLFGTKIKSKPKSIAFGKERIKNGLAISDEILRNETKAIFAAHGHYDHAMDIPYIQQLWLNNNAEIVLNESAMRTCANVIAPDQLINVETKLSTRDCEGESFDFSGTNGAVLKVYPILAAHNPHSRNVKLFSGSTLTAPKYFDLPTAKSRVNDWLEGRTVSFLIDVVEQNEIVYRIFLQSSSANFPDGIPPRTLLDRKAVDLAILGAASFQYSETTYPCTYLDTLNAKDVMFIHWEDFFRRYEKETRSLRKQDFARLFKKILPECREDFILPKPGVVINAGY